MAKINNTPTFLNPSISDHQNLACQLTTTVSLFHWPLWGVRCPGAQCITNVCCISQLSWQPLTISTLLLPVTWQPNIFGSLKYFLIQPICQSLGSSLEPSLGLRWGEPADVYIVLLLQTITMTPGCIHGEVLLWLRWPWWYFHRWNATLA